MINKFERGQETKKSIDIGLSAATFNLEKVLIIRYNKVPSRITLTDNAAQKVLKEIQKNPKLFFEKCNSNKRAFGFVRSGERDSHWVMENLSGELVNFKNQLYSIPKL